jgi:DHA1 family inner membrane transport protein
MSEHGAAAMRGSTTVPGKRSLTALLAVLMAGTFLMGTTEFVLAGLLPEIATDFHTSVARAGLTVTVFAAGMIVGAPTVSLLTLRMPRRWTLVFAMGLFALGHALVAATGSFELVLGARFLTGMATGAFWSVGSAVAARAAGPAARSRALGLILGGGMLANVLGVPLGSFAGQVLGWRSTFWALAALAVLAAVILAWLLPPDPPEQPVVSLRNELTVLRSGRLWLLLTICAMVNGGILSVYSYLAPMTRRAGLPDTVLPFVLMAFGASALVGSIVGGRLGDFHPYATIVTTAAVSMIGGVGILVFGAQPAALLFFFALIGLVGLSANPALVSLALEFGGGADLMAAALPASTFNLGTAIGTGIAGAALETGLGALAPALVGAGAAALIFVPLIFLVLAERRHTVASAATAGV